MLTLDKADIKTLRIRPSKGKAAVFTRPDADAPWAVEGAPSAKINMDAVQELVKKFGELEFFKLADPDESEGEHMEVYEKIVAA